MALGDRMRDFLAAYCERAGMDGFFAEPLNLVTNGAFLIVAYIAWRRYLDETEGSLRGTWDLALLIVLIFLIGIGSAAWHAVPMRITLIADVLPITLFIHIYLVVFARRILALSWINSAVLLVAYVGASILFAGQFPRGAYNGSVGYLPSLSMMAIMTAVLFACSNGARWGLLAATAVFAASLTARTGDHAVCDAFPLGTHFVWHTLNSVVLYLLVMLVVTRHADGLDASRSQQDRLFGEAVDASGADTKRKG